MNGQDAVTVAKALRNCISAGQQVVLRIDGEGGNKK